MRAFTNQRGIVLIATLWLLVVLEVLVTSQSTQTRVETELARNRVDAAKARSAAEAGVFLAIDRLARQQGKKEWLLRPDGSPYRISYQEANVLMSVFDEAGKVDLNAARAEFLRKLIISISPDVDQGLRVSDAILDWRDVDHLARPNGAEDEEYRSNDMPYGAKDEYFDNLEELLLVMGIDSGLYMALTRFVTIRTGMAGINPAVAQRTVLLSIPGVDTQQVDAYLQAREQYYAGEQPMPIFPVTNIQYISRDRDQIYTVHVQAHTVGGTIAKIAVTTRIAAQRARQGEMPYEILAWNETDHYRMPPLSQSEQR